MKIIKVNNNSDQISNIIKLLCDDTNLIIVNNFDAKYQLLKRLHNLGLIKNKDLDIAIQIESDIIKFADIIALFNDISIKNIINILQHDYIRQELKFVIDDSIFFVDKYPEIKLAVENSKKTNNFKDFANIWLDVKIDIDFSDEILTNKILFIQNLYTNIFDSNIYICNIGEIPKQFFNTTILADSNSKVYNGVVPYLYGQNIDIMPKNELEINNNFLLASHILRSKNIFLMQNLQIKTISYLLLYYNNLPTINFVAQKNEMILSDSLAFGMIPNFLTPKSIEKLSVNPFYFYLEYILNLKQAKQVRTTIYDFDIELAIFDIIQKKTINNYDKLIVFDKYKIIKNTKNVIKVLKCQNGLNEKIIQNAKPTNINIGGIEIVAHPVFLMSGEEYFYTKSGITKIKNGTDVKSVVISSILSNATFVGYKSSGYVAKSEISKSVEFYGFINYYKNSCQYKNTQQKNNFSLYYQHLSRNLLIKL
jgi:hypothetical protein